MNAAARAQQAYSPTMAPIRSTRRIEYDVLARITFRLKTAVQGKEFNKLVESLDENRSFWRALAVDVADPKNELPKDLRARIFYLSEFTHSYTSKLIRRKEKDATPLLEINMAILRGLKTGEAAE